eukprot:scaffold587_cov339-Prasinococcus_capsulatus_cf.AAC.4
MEWGPRQERRARDAMRPTFLPSRARRGCMPRVRRRAAALGAVEECVARSRRPSLRVVPPAVAQQHPGGTLSLVLRSCTSARASR